MKGTQCPPVHSPVLAERVPPRFALGATYFLSGLCMLWLVRIHDPLPAMLYGVLYGLFNGGKETLDAVIWADYFGRASVGAIRGYSRPLIVGAHHATGKRQGEAATRQGVTGSKDRDRNAVLDQLLGKKK